MISTTVAVGEISIRHWPTLLRTRRSIFVMIGGSLCERISESTNNFIMLNNKNCKSYNVFILKQWFGKMGTRETDSFHDHRWSSTGTTPRTGQTVSHDGSGSTARADRDLETVPPTSLLFQSQTRISLVQGRHGIVKNDSFQSHYTATAKVSMSVVVGVRTTSFIAATV